VFKLSQIKMIGRLQLLVGGGEQGGVVGFGQAAAFPAASAVGHVPVVQVRPVVDAVGQ